MSFHSMTGHGRGVAQLGAIRAEVELYSVNRKQLDILVQLPRAYASLEASVIKEVGKFISRGRITGEIRIEHNTTGKELGFRVNEALAQQYVKELREVATRLNVEDDLSIGRILKLPDVMNAVSEKVNPKSAWRSLSVALKKALKELGEMRKKEGVVLQRDLEKRLGRLQRLVERIAPLTPKVQARYAKRLEERFAQLNLQDVDNSLAKEVAILAERSDITEELTRLRSHLDQAFTLSAAKKPVGRTLDFLAQELFREINTIASKASEAQISKVVIAFKSELEKIREQAQNVE